MNPWMRNLLCGGGGGGGPVLPPAGRTMLANLKSSLILDEGTGNPTWSRATKAWGFNELGYLEELASGCAFFGGARLVRNLAPKSEVINAGWGLGGVTASDANTLLESAGGTVHQLSTQISALGTYLLEVWIKRGAGATRHVRLEVSSSDTARVNFNLDTGAVASIFQNGALSLINYGADASVDAGGYRRFYIRVNASASASSTFYPARLTESLNGPISYSGDGTSSILISKVKISDVTGYDASYVPEYVSIGVPLNTVRTTSEDFSDAAWTKTTLTVSGTNTVVCANSTSVQRLSQETSGAAAPPTVIGQSYMFCARVGYVTNGVRYLQLTLTSGGFGTGQYCNFDLTTGTLSATGCTATATAVDGLANTWDISIRATATGAGSYDICNIVPVNSLADTRLPSFVGDGIKSFSMLRAWSANVSQFAAGYVHPYYRVGTGTNVFFGAGIDGAKYFETDWQGAPIPAANLLGFRREAAAINNLMSSRDFTAQLRAAMDAQYWVASTTGTTKVTNGDFPSDTSGWTIIGAGSATVVGAKLRLDSTAAIVQANQVISGLTVGKMYQVQADITKVSGSAFLYTYIYTDSVGTTTCATRARNATGAVSYCFVAVATDQAIRLSNVTVGNVWDIDNVTITECTIKAETTATGLDGIANTATTLTAAAAGAIILQPITLASAVRCASAYVKRRTGTGTISFTQDGGSTWTDITSQINGSTWSRVQITATLANPSVGFKISTSGDAIDVDCVQNEAGAAATSPIVTTTAAVTRDADSLTYQTASNIDFAVGTLYCEARFASSLTTRRAVLVGPDGYSYINSGDANTLWKAYDGTNIVSKSGLSDISTAKRKRVVSWGTGLKVTGDGISPASGSFDGAFGSGSSMEIGQNINGYIGPVAIYNYQMTDAELQAITT